MIRFSQVSKAYPVYASPKDRLKELLTFNRARFHTDFWALREIDFTVGAGETFCIIGENGSGKSTLLQLMAGILQPTSGEIQVDGRVAALLELGSGFNPEFTGRQNIYLNAAIFGLTHDETEAKFADIEAFAEIGTFIDQPVKTYSSGMAVRLAFSVAIHVEPQVLLVDEALAVGDIYFRQRCMRKIHELRAAGTTIVFVSHSIADVKSIGDRTMWLDRGNIRALGATDDVVAQYAGAILAKDHAYVERTQREHPDEAKSLQAPPELETVIPNIDHRHGSGRAQIMGINIYSERGEPLRILQPLTRVTVRISAQANDYLSQPNVGFMLRNHLGLDFLGTNCLREQHELPPLLPGEMITVDFSLELPELYNGIFSFSPAIANGDLVTYEMCDWIDNAITLQMVGGEAAVYGFMHLPCRVAVNAVLKPAEASHG